MRESIPGGPLHGLDDDDFERRPSCFEAQAKLLLQRHGERWAIDGTRGGPEDLVKHPFKIEVVAALESGPDRSRAGRQAARYSPPLRSSSRRQR